MVDAVFEKTTYKDVEAVKITTSRVIAIFIPSQGGKLASLKSKTGSREYMAQADGNEYRLLTLDGSYVESECSGFDDMFPTIDPWEADGKAYIDHGEICRCPLNYSIGSNMLVMDFNSKLLPYSFKKTITQSNNGGIFIEYAAKNLSESDMDFIWASHFMVSAEVNGEIITPFKKGDSVELAFSSDESFGTKFTKSKFPYAANKKSKINTSDEFSKDGLAYKYYFSQRVPRGFCGYKYKSDNTKLMLRFPKDKVPYLGIWVNNGSFKGMHNIALEICTGAFDRPDIARERNQFSVIKGGQDYEWFMEIDVIKKATF